MLSHDDSVFQRYLKGNGNTFWGDNSISIVLHLNEYAFKTPCHVAFANSVDPEQLASDLDLHCLPFRM